MKTLRTTTVLVLAGSFVLLAGCYDGPSDIPPVIGAAGFVDSGWVYYQQGNFVQARDYFQDALEVDASYMEAHLGAGLSSLHLVEYWPWVNGYLFTAAQLADGTSPVIVTGETQYQDEDATVFEILTDTTGGGWDEPILYRFQTLNSDLMTIHHTTVIEHVSAKYEIDSIIVESADETWAYVLVPPFELESDTLAWIDPGFAVGYEYSYRSAVPVSQAAADAMIGLAMYENASQGNGSTINGGGLCWAVLYDHPAYSFGEGENWAGMEVIDNVNAACIAAQLSFADEAFMVAWQVCKVAGYGTDLDPADDDFVYQLMLVIDSMQN